MPDPFEVCETAARAGGRVLLDWVGRFAVSTKGPRDFVTEADLAAQNEIRRIVLDAFPEHGFQGEESIPGQATADHTPSCPRRAPAAPTPVPDKSSVPGVPDHDDIGFIPLFADPHPR